MISVVIPVYNTNIEYIKQCFDSIEKQTYQNYEIVVVNDGSENHTAQFLHNYRPPNKEIQYSVIDQTKQGISKALNVGIQNSEYDIIARMDADDIMLPDRLEKQLEYFTNNNVDILGGQMILFGDMNFITNHPLVIPKDIMAYIDWFMNHPTVMYGRRQIMDLGGYNSEYDGCEDLELWCRALASGMILHNMVDIVLKHRRHKSNATVTQNNIDIKHKISHIRSFYYHRIKETIC